MDSPNKILQPIPRRAFEITPATPDKSRSHSPSPKCTTPGHLSPKSSQDLTSSTSSRTKSFLNLTSSTLFGIYSPAEGLDNERTAPPTPKGGAQTPQYPTTSQEKSSLGRNLNTEAPRRSSHVSIHYQKPTTASFLLRNGLLFLSGLAYGTVVTHLHDDRRIAPIQVEQINHHSYGYLAFWAVAGVILGNLLPFIDARFAESAAADDEIEKLQRRSSSLFDGNGKFAADWQSVIRGVGAFIGIAYAIRKLPWESTLQVSLTLAFANPALWWLIDRTRSGFLLSFVTALAGTVFTLVIAPGVVPSPATISSSWSTEPLSFERLKSTECIGVATWIASVLFCSCVCFGNIGRRLALPQTMPYK